MDTGSAGAGTGSTSTGSAGAGTSSTDTSSARAGTSSASTGSARAGAGSTDTGSAGAGADSTSTGEGPVEDACGTCGHAPDRLAPGLLIATGQLLPISDVHRLARTSRLVRMVINAKGQVLDMGRAVRLATPAQRRAVLARYATCYREGCPIPADMAEIDHVQGWAEGGTTDLDLLAPACTWHNRDKATHPDRYRTRRNHDGTWTLLYHGKSRFAGRFRR
ncbi:HNH endonuclease [Acrocarpospora macrocephala]|uniref:HNH endonuclease n=1 Tax=Acrocarpospora macrocephala TaxID=150177 RepID=UPI0031E35A14